MLVRKKLYILILAAGASTRLGQPKQLVEIAGCPALVHVVKRALATDATSVGVVLGAHEAEITPILQDLPVSTYINPGWQEGMASSIRYGINSIFSSCDAVLVMLGDQVGVGTADLQQLIHAWNAQDGVIAASCYNEELGAPVIYPRFVFGELLQLKGDEGAKRLLNQLSDRVVSVPMPMAAYDLDTSTDVECVQALFAKGDL